MSDSFLLHPFPVILLSLKYPDLASVLVFHFLSVWYYLYKSASLEPECVCVCVSACVRVLRNSEQNTDQPEFEAAGYAVILKYTLLIQPVTWPLLFKIKNKIYVRVCVCVCLVLCLGKGGSEKKDKKNSIYNFKSQVKTKLSFYKSTIFMLQ